MNRPCVSFRYYVIFEIMVTKTEIFFNWFYLFNLILKLILIVFLFFLGKFSIMLLTDYGHSRFQELMVSFKGNNIPLELSFLNGYIF